jgi:hypothetical protein
MPFSALWQHLPVQEASSSNLIKSLLLDDEPGPLYLTAQGEECTIARAQKSINA